MKLTPAPSFGKFPIYNADVQTAPAFRPSRGVGGAIRAADGVYIVSPEYNWSIPAGLKNAIDWASREKEVCFKDKPVALQSARRACSAAGACNIICAWR